MPTPRDGESRQEFIGRCVPIVMREGTAKDKEQAVAICASMFDGKGKRIAPVPIRSVPMPDGGTMYRAYAVTFNGPEDKDVYDTYFDRSTDFMLHLYDRRPWFYDHGRSEVGRYDIGSWFRSGIDEYGVYVEGRLHDSAVYAQRGFAEDEIRRHENYRDAVETLIEAGVLYPSSGTASHLADIEEDGHVRLWPIIEVSSTVTPGDWRMVEESKISPAVRSALAVLEGEGGNMNLQDKLRALLDGEGDEEDVEESPGGEDVAEAESEAKVNVGEVAERAATMILESINADGSAIRSAIEMIDNELSELSTRIGGIEELVNGLAQGEAERLQDTLAGEQWVRDLFVASRDAEPVSDDDADEIRSSQNIETGSLWQRATGGS